MSAAPLHHLAACLCVLGIAGCPGQEPGSEDDAQGDDSTSADSDPGSGAPELSLEPAEVAWILDWEAGQASFDEETGSWEVTNDLGYAIHLESGWVASYAVSLTPCAGALPGSLQLESGRRSRASLAIGDTLARPQGGHPGDTDPSAWVFELFERTHEPEPIPTFADPLAIEGDVYCGGHYVIAPSLAAEQAAIQDGDDDPELVAASLFMRGSWIEPGGSEPVPFSLRDEQAYGKLHDIAESFEIAPTATPGELMEVRLVRHVDAIFDGVDFATMSDADASWQVLRNLTTQLHFEVSG